MSFLHRLFAAPQRSRDRATKALNSELIGTIADHLVKIMLYGHYKQHRSKWVKDVARQLRELTFLISKFSVRKNPDNPTDRTRVIKEMHFKAKTLMQVLDDETSDAYWRVVEDKNYADLNIQDPKGIERGVFSTLGFTLKDAEGPLGKGLRLFYKDELLADSSQSGA